MKAHSSVEGFYSRSWTYMQWDFFPLGTDRIALPLPFGQYSGSLKHALLQQEQGNTRQHRNNPAANFFFFFLQ